MHIVFEIRSVAEHTEVRVKCLFSVISCRNKIIEKDDRFGFYAFEYQRRRS